MTLQIKKAGKRVHAIATFPENYPYWDYKKGLTEVGTKSGRG